MKITNGARAPGLYASSTSYKFDYAGAAIKIKAAALYHWMAGRRNGVSVSEMARFLFQAPAATKGRRLIKNLREEGDFYIFDLDGFTRPFHYPREYELVPLYVIACNTSFPDDWRYYEVEETRVAPGNIVLDCGAAEGIFGMMAAGRCKKVYLIEPAPRFADCLERTFQGMENVELLRVALCDRDGHADMTESGFGSSLDIPRKGTSTDIQVSTIDRLFYERSIPVNYIKANLEGSELLMLKGAEKTLREYTPRIAITSYHRKEHAEEICRYLAAIDSRYNFRTKGISEFGTPVMVHAWVD